MKKNIIYRFIAVITIYCAYQAYSWRSPSINQQATMSTHNCIYGDQSRKTYALKTSENIPFKVNLVSNSKANCINSYFPSIHIKTDAPHNAWLHIVYTDARAPKLQKFIDTAPIPDNEIYPFYTLQLDFYDAPIWRYSLFSKPLSFWRGHAYAVMVDHNSKTIQYVGGIAWGFKLSFWHLRPISIKPFTLNKNSWENDWLTFKTKLTNYKNI